MTVVRKRSVEIAGHRTSVSIEAPFWDALKVIALRRRISLNELITEIDSARDGNLSSAIRLYVLRDLQQRQASG
jgi:predicted DNA-binding ribbon-helix-helix protein